MVKKTLLVMASGIMFAAIGQQYTNVLQVLNTPLTTESMRLIITSDHSTPDRLFLSFLKSSAQGDLPAFLSLFTDTCLASELGVTDKNAFTNEDVLDFQMFLSDGSVTNKTLVSYSCTISGNVANVTAKIRLRAVNKLMDEDMEMRFLQTDDVWKISQWQGE